MGKLSLPSSPCIPLSRARDVLQNFDSGGEHIGGSGSARRFSPHFPIPQTPVPWRVDRGDLLPTGPRQGLGSYRE